MVKCTVEGCGCFEDVSRAAACDLGWRFIQLETTAGSKYRVFCPAHDVKSIVDDLRGLLTAMGGDVKTTTHVVNVKGRR